MSWWNTLMGAFGVGRLANLDQGLQHSGNQSRATEADISVSDERAMSVSAVFACTRLIVQSGSTLPLHLFRKQGDGDRIMVPDSEQFSKVLLRRPNQYMHGKQFRQAMWTQRVLWGNAYARIIRRGDGEIASLLPLKPEHVSVHREDYGVRFEYSTETGSKTYYNRVGKRPEIMHWRGFSPDGVIGLSPLAYARHSLGISVSADRHASRAFNGRPNGVLTTDQVLKPEQRRQVRDLYSRIGDSAIGNGQWWLLEGGFQYQSIGMPPDDLQMLESRQYQVSDICRFYGVPAVMIDGGQNPAAWPASYEKQVLAFLKFTLEPYLDELEEQLISDVVPEGVYAEHNVEGLLRSDSVARAQFYATAVQNGWMTRNEVRQRENLPMMDGADDLTIQVNLSPADELGDTDVTEQTPPAV